MENNNHSLKILQVFSSLNMGGAESRMMDVYRQIDRERFVFSFLTMNRDNQYYEEEIQSLGGQILKIDPPRKSGSFKNFLSILRILKNGKYDVVHAHTSFHCGIVMLAGWITNTHVRISHCRTTGSENTSIRNRVSLLLGRGLVAMFSTDRLAISPEAGKYLFSNKPFSVVPNAIDCEKYFNTSEQMVRELRERYHIGERTVCLGLVGRFDPMKNHAFALSVFKDYHRINQNSVLFFVGDGNLRGDINRMAIEMGISNSVIFTGIQSNINVWMKLFDVLLVPSIFEGLGGVILEAQAAGTPVLKSDTFTDESDMQLGLVRKLPIDNGTAAWISAVDKMQAVEKPDNNRIAERFDNRGYSIYSEIEKLEKIYRGI